MNKKEIKKLQKIINYKFNKIKLLDLALTHRSANKNHNERLEFLGDSILNFIITLSLYNKFPKINEGNMSRIRSKLVKENTLAQIARKFKIGEYLNLGNGEIKNKGFQKESILANTMEAIIGSIFLDSDYEITKKTILNWYQKRLNNILPEDKQKDPKTKLQEYLQSHKLSLPKYFIFKISGKSHNRKFSIHCKISCIEKLIQGNGSSKKKAEQSAALKALKILKIN